MLTRLAGITSGIKWWPATVSSLGRHGIQQLPPMLRRYSGDGLPVSSTVQTAAHPCIVTRDAGMSELNQPSPRETHLWRSTDGTCADMCDMHDFTPCRHVLDIRLDYGSMRSLVGCKAIFCLIRSAAGRTRSRGTH